MHRQVADSLHALGLCLVHKGLFLEARSLLDRALTMRKKLLSAGELFSPYSAERFNFLYFCPCPLYLILFHIQEHPDVAESTQALGQVYLCQGKLEECLVLFERALTARRHLLGAQHPFVAESLCSIAEVHNLQFNGAMAYDLLADSLKIRRAAFGNDSLVTAETFFGIAKNLQVSGILCFR
jgi:tetratricopeptide (TPR) repeat protein